ncbi:MAG: YbjN domain-containing protein [Corallococcus sp.]|nr:YbjN domain-containing protein [Corallococcus sp.]MCM1358917.1 YbjN domain-containing protein [Corallococcus sp.]MCM1394905.1 YbjN domain-containing protein [Corallococcus sp.]
MTKTTDAEKTAKKNYVGLCNALDKMKWQYTKIPEKLSIETNVKGKSLPIKLSIRINVNLETITAYSPLPFDVPQERRKHMAMALAQANYNMVHGHFDYRPTGNKVLFCMSTNWADTELSFDVFNYLIYVACKTVDDYNEKLQTVATTNVSMQEVVNLMK